MTPADVQGSCGNSESLLSASPRDLPLIDKFQGLANSAQRSRLVQRLRRRYEAELALLPPGPPSRASMLECLKALSALGHDTSAALRILRQLVMERLVVLDCEQGAPLHTITRAVTDLAEVALDMASREACAQLDERHGAPMTEDGQRAQMWVIGMGKLGARELNVSSDIDLIYIYDEDGETTGTPDGRGRISVHEYFTRAVKLIYGLIGDTTEHGFVFRVDLALRPNGNSGPTVCSLEALEEYMLVQGREWERFAWLKSRVVAPSTSIENGSAQSLRSVVLPFVFRKYLDYAVFDSLRVLHQQIRDHAAKRSAGRPERANDVKLSRGGIREIEFTVQLLQVVRAGQFPELRTRPTLEALERVARAGLMPQDTADALARAYVFLRQVEHRIQYLDDQQTHVLPTDDTDLEWIAQSMGYEGSCAFLCELDSHREFVAQEFDRLLGAEAPCKNCRSGKNGSPSKMNEPPADFDAVLELFPSDVRERLAQWHDHPRVLALRDGARLRLRRLLQRTAEWLSEGRVSSEAVLRLADWVEPLLRRESYLAMLLERPAVHERLLRILGTARWPARYLLQHPGVIDELSSPALLNSRFEATVFERELEERRAALARGGEDDEENLLNLLRRAHHAEVFRTLVRDVEGQLSVEQVADDLSALADAILRLTSNWCWSRLKQRHREQPRFGIIGYGKLGGKELGYGGDLDIVFVFDDDDESAPEIYSIFVRKLINWLTVKTGEGDLFEIDTALRPNGNSGLLITSFEAYADYQEQRGSNTAWTWEHQAMTRARFVCGESGLDDRFDAVRLAVITAPREDDALKAEVISMREKMRQGRPVKVGLFDIKHSPGGMVDAEFTVQYLVLAHSNEHPELRPNKGNITLLQRAEKAGLVPPGIGSAAADAYRTLRRVQHHARLNEEPTQLAPESMREERTAIENLWRAVFST